MFAFTGQTGENSPNNSDVDSSDSFDDEEFGDASDFDEDNITREQRRKEFDQLCRENKFGEAPSISSDESDSEESFTTENPEGQSRLVVADSKENDAPDAIATANSEANFLSYRPGVGNIEIVPAKLLEPNNFSVDKSISMSLTRIPDNERFYDKEKLRDNKRCDSDSYLAVDCLKKPHNDAKSQNEAKSVPAVEVNQTSDVNGLNLLCQQQRQWLDELRSELFRSKEEWQRESRLLTHKLMLSEGEKRQLDEQNRALRQRINEEQLRTASMVQQLRDESRHAQRLAEEKLQTERDAIAAREEANSLQDQLISLTRTSGLYQERNAMAEKWAAERSSLLNQVENLRLQLAERQSYVERAEESIKQLEERCREALNVNDQIMADKRRIELERDRLSRDLELAHTEVKISSDSAKTSTPKAALNQFEMPTFESSNITTPRFQGGENMLKSELTKALAANRDNVEKIRSLEAQIVDMARKESKTTYFQEKSNEEFEELVKDRDDLKWKLNDIIEENRRLSAKLRDFVAESDHEKQNAIESCRTACLRLHEDAKKSLYDVHRHEIEELQKKHEVAMNQMTVEMRGLSNQIDDAKSSYLQACSEKAEVEEAIRREYEAKLNELRSLLACETSALQEKLSIKEKQLEALRVDQHKAMRGVVLQVSSAIDAASTSFKNQQSTMAAKLATMYGRLDALSIAFNRVNYKLQSNRKQAKSETTQSNVDHAIPDAVTQLRSLFLDTAQRMREVYVAHSKAADERNRYLLTTVVKLQKQQQKHVLSSRNGQKIVES